MAIVFESTSAAPMSRKLGNGIDAEPPSAVTPAEQLIIFDKIFGDKDFSSGFSKFVKDKQDNEPLIYNQMSDNELMKHLSDYLGSGIANVTINNKEIETAQAIVAELNMSEEELAEVDHAVTARAAQAKQAKIEEDRTKDFYADEAARRLEEHRAQWDATMHKIGDKEYSGAELHAMHEWLQDEKNQEKLDQEIMERDGVSKEEAKRRRTEVQELLALMEKQRNNEKLSAEEKRRYEELKNKPTVQTNLEVAKTMQGKGLNVELDNSNAAIRAGNEDISTEAGFQNLSEVASSASAPNIRQSTWSFSAPVVKVEESLSSSYNMAAIGKVEQPQEPANAQILTKAVGISEPSSPYA